MKKQKKVISILENALISDFILKSASAAAVLFVLFSLLCLSIVVVLVLIFNSIQSCSCLYLFSFKNFILTFATMFVTV